MNAPFPIVIHHNPTCGTSRDVLAARIVFGILTLALAACSQPHATIATQPDAAPTTSTEPLAIGALKTASPAEIRAATEHYGARAVVHSLWGDATDQGWSRVEDGIGRGDPEWLALVPVLRPGSDGATGEGLEIAISDALQHNAPGVLRLLVATHRTARLSCFFRRIEPTDAEVRAYYGAAVPAVEAVSDADLQTIKAECLAELRSSEQRELR